jgi:hypothetical protein
MKLIVYLALAVISLTGSLSAAETTNESSWSYEVSTHVWSQYHAASDFGGSGAIYHDKPVIQTDLSATWSGPLDISFGIWHSAGLDDSGLSSDFGDELDYYLNFEKEIGGISLSLYVAYFDTVDLFRTPGDVVSITPKIGVPVEIGEHKVTPFVQWNTYVPTGQGALAGNLFQLGVEHGFSVRSYDISHTMAVAYDDGAFGLENGYIFNYIFTGSFAVSEKFTVEVPMFKFTTPMSDLKDGRGSEVTFGAGVVFSF